VYTAVADKQVGLEFAEAWFMAFQLRVGNSDEAGATTGAATIGEGKDVDLTTEMTHVQR